MSPSFDGLACAEDGSSVFGDGREGPGGWEEIGASDGGQEVITVQGEEFLGLLLDKQCQHLPRSDYLGRLRNGDLDSAARKDAVDWIGKVHSYFSFGPLSAYLSINYLDRFLSSYELPRGQAWMTQLLAVACLSLAAKMEETDVPLPQDLQVGEAKHVFEARTIRRMELLVLSTLCWRMQTVTPFNFLDFFLRKINGDDVLPRLSMSRSIQLVLSLVKGIEYLEFRPSELAAAVAISVARENQALDAEKALSLLTEHVQKEKLVKCIEMISEKRLIGGSGKSATSAATAPQSPIGVLDAAACLSYRSDKTGGGEEGVVISTGGNSSSSSSPSSHDVPDNKRRRID